ncbi:MAG: preprotein translocase subunit SecE [Candidatus Paceibacterota bacterium]
MSKVTEFLRDVKIEMARVSWPTRMQTARYTLVVVLASLAIAGFLAAWDWIFGQVVTRII